MTQLNRNSVFDRPMPPGYREELQALMAVEPPRPPRRMGSVLLFQLGTLRLALPTRVASAVSPVLHIARIPHRSGTVLLGLVAFRGDILPCCSLAKLLEVSRNETGAARMLILEESPGRLWAVPIDGVLGIRTIPEETFAERPPLAAHWISGSFEDRGGAFHLLDNENLFRQITLATA
ncbi:MAG TPA: chemotaxis protein CheW [Terracidiphilus sp.]|jgi:chemotaxis-related protein WspD